MTRQEISQMSDPRDLPPLKALRAFEATARLGGMSRAGDELHVTHGAVSRQIRALEEQLGVALFRREGRGLALTEAGLRLREVSGEVFERLREVCAELKAGSRQGPFVLGCPGRLVARWFIPRLDRLGGFSPASPQDYFAWLGRLEAVEGLGMYRNNIAQTLQRGGGPERLSVARVTANFFDVLRVRASAGRLFGPEHDVAGEDAVIVLSHTLWVRTFAADPNVIGQTVTLGKTPRQIVGILEPGVAYPVGLEPATDAYIPTVATAAERITVPLSDETNCPVKNSCPSQLRMPTNNTSAEPAA